MPIVACAVTASAARGEALGQGVGTKAYAIGAQIAGDLLFVDGKSCFT